MSHPGPPPQAPYGYPPQQQPQPQPYGYPYAPPQPGLPYASAFAPPLPPRAGWGQRAGAFLLDVAINFGPMWLLMGVAIGIEESSGESGEVVANILSWLGILAMIVAVVFQLMREGLTGQTVGKGVLGIRAMRERDGQQPLGIGLAFGRRLLQCLNYPLFGLGWWWPLWDDKSQTFADKLTGVVVVRADPAPVPQPGTWQ
ncbi:RDD family protein [Streptomyces daliensis]|uniref:RDD family protein n=1 Tax=Streptomyces daliensis TaxID=299421 RepID=A0A8T4IIV4_9ACTN|nr:RDD family protein [Streptomyces daliensis]